MGYAKEPGSFWDTVGTVVVIMIGIELLLTVVMFFAGTPELIPVANAYVYSQLVYILTQLKEFVFSWEGLAVIVAVGVLGAILFAWRDSQYEE